MNVFPAKLQLQVELNNREQQLNDDGSACPVLPCPVLLWCVCVCVCVCGIG